MHYTYEYATHYSDNEHLRYSIEDHSALNLEYEGRAREIQDLLFNGEQANQVLDELAAIVDNPLTTHKFHAANRSRWEYDPYVVSRERDGLFYKSVRFDNFQEVDGLIWRDRYGKIHVNASTFVNNVSRRAVIFANNSSNARLSSCFSLSDFVVTSVTPC